jgi:hypothetical protein
MKDKDFARLVARKLEERNQAVAEAMAKWTGAWSELGSFKLVPDLSMQLTYATGGSAWFALGVDKEDDLHVCGELIITLLDTPQMVALLICLPPPYVAPADLEARGKRLLDLLGRGGRHLQIHWRTIDPAGSHSFWINPTRHLL